MGHKEMALITMKDTMYTRHVDQVWLWKALERGVALPLAAMGDPLRDIENIVPQAIWVVSPPPEGREPIQVTGGGG